MAGSGTSRSGRGGDGFYKKRGIWYFRVLDWNGRRRAISARTRSYDEAKQRRRDHLADLEKGVDRCKTAKVTFAAASAQWVEAGEIAWAPETVRARKSRLRSVVAKIGEMPLPSISADTIRRYQLARAHLVSPTTVNTETKCIVAVLKRHGLWERLKQDSRLLREPKPRGRKVTDEEFDSLMAVAERRRYLSIMADVLIILRETGLRHKELRSLRLGDVDAGNRCFSIPRSSTKTDAGERVVPLTEEAYDALRRLLNRAALLGSKEPHHYLFPATKFEKIGRAVRRIADPQQPQASFRDAWQTLRRLAGVDKRLRLHDFRHTIATDYGAAGVPSGVAMRLMGWTSPAMRARYEHFQSDTLRSEIDRVAAQRREARKQPTSVPVGNVIQFPARRRI